jgi:hypothetical protein
MPGRRWQTDLLGRDPRSGLAEEVGQFALAVKPACDEGGSATPRMFSGLLGFG